MKYIILSIIFLSFIFTINTAKAQVPEIEKLKTQLEEIDTDSTRVHIMNSIAYLSISQSKNITEATGYANKALKLAKENNYQKGIATAYYNLGLINYYQKNYKNAEEYHLKGLKIREQLKDESAIANSSNALSLAYRSQLNYPKALNYAVRSLKIIEQIGSPRTKAFMYGNVAELYIATENYEEAIEYYEQALELNKELDDKEKVALIYKDLGRIYRLQKRYSESVNSYLKSSEIFAELNNLLGIAISLRNIAKSYFRMEEYQKALEYFNQCDKFLTQLPNQKERAYWHGDMGAYYNTMEAYAKAEKHFSQAWKNIQEERIEDLELKREVAEGLSKASAEIGNYRQAYEFQVEFKSLSDTIRSDEITKKMTQISMQHEFDKQKKIAEVERQKERERQEEELKRQRLYRYITSGGLVIMLLFAFVVYRSYRIKRRDNKLLAEQKQAITEQNDKLRSQKAKIEAQNHKINSSIRYAKTIQQAILPTQRAIEQFFETYILYRPKHIVSGDFYWFHNKPATSKTGEKVFVAVVDCTGHGVPGSIMSMIGNSLLNEIVKEKRINDPAEILNYLNDGINTALRQEESDNNDGMDVCLLKMEQHSDKEYKISYAGAGRPLYYVKAESGNIEQLKGDNKSIGGILSILDKDPFTQAEVILNPGDVMYLTTDGLKDQNAPEKKRLGVQTVMDIFEKNHAQPMREQKRLLEKELDDFQSGIEQLDDITVMGLRIKNTEA